VCVAVRVAVRVAMRATGRRRESCAVVMQRVAVCVAVCVRCVLQCATRRKRKSFEVSAHSVWCWCFSGVAMCCRVLQCIAMCVAVCCTDKGHVLKKTRKRGNDETEAKQALAIRHYNGTILIQILRIPLSALMP